MTSMIPSILDRQIYQGTAIRRWWRPTTAFPGPWTEIADVEFCDFSTKQWHNDSRIVYYLTVFCD